MYPSARLSRPHLYRPAHISLGCIAMLIFMAFGGLLLGSPAGSSKSDTRAKASALIRKALDVSDFRTPGSPPFELRASLTVPLQNGHNAHNAIGTYLLDWASPDRWREEIHVDNYSRIRVGGAGKYWQLRSLDYELIPFDDLSGALGYQQRLLNILSDPAWTDTKTKISVKHRKLNGRDADCLSVESHSASDFYCFDSQSGALLEDGERSGTMADYSDFTSFQGKIVPGTMQIMDSRNLILLFRLQSVAPLENPDAALFNPPPNAEEWPTCSAPVGPRLLRANGPAFARFNPPATDGTVIVYFVIGTDGLVHNAKLLAASTKQDGDALLEALKSHRYQPQTCNGVPQRTEEIMFTHFTVY